MEEYRKEYPVENCITIEHVRAGEWNEAICFSLESKPRTEIAAQQSRNGYWNIFFVSSRSALTLGTGFSREKAYQLANTLAGKILTEKNPAKIARSYGRGNGIRPREG